MRTLALLLTFLPLSVLAAPVKPQDVEAALTTRFMREMAHDMAKACAAAKEPEGESRLEHFEAAWKGKLAPLGQRLDEIYQAIPAEQMDVMLKAQRKRLGITESVPDFLKKLDGPKRKTFCGEGNKLVNVMGSDPEPLLAQRNSSSESLLAYSEADMAEFRKNIDSYLEPLPDNKKKKEAKKETKKEEKAPKQ